MRETNHICVMELLAQNVARHVRGTGFKLVDAPFFAIRDDGIKQGRIYPLTKRNNDETTGPCGCIAPVQDLPQQADKQHSPFTWVALSVASGGLEAGRLQASLSNPFAAVRLKNQKLLG